MMTVEQVVNCIPRVSECRVKLRQPNLGSQPEKVREIADTTARILDICRKDELTSEEKDHIEVLTRYMAAHNGKNPKKSDSGAQEVDSAKVVAACAKIIEALETDMKQYFLATQPEIARRLIEKIEKRAEVNDTAS